MAKIVSLTPKSSVKTKVVGGRGTMLQGTRIRVIGTPDPGVTTIFVQTYDYGKDIEAENYAQHARIVDKMVLTMLGEGANIQDMQVEEYCLSDKDNGI